MMISVWYDPDCDQIWITDADRPYPSRSLRAFIDPGIGKIGIRLKAGSAADIVMTPFSNLMRHDGSGFASAEDAKAYLDIEFGKHRNIGLAPLPFTAGEPIGGHKAVRIAAGGLVCLASSDEPSHAGTVVGVSLTAADEGDSLDVMIQGDVIEASWSWAPGPVFLGRDGALVQVPPASGFVRQIGTATNSVTLIVAPSTPIILVQ